MPYSHTTLAQASTQLAEQINDTAGVFWTSAERTVAITEALRTWGALTSYWRDRKQFTTTSGTPFYDLAAQAAFVGVLDPTLKDVDILPAIQYHLVEPLGVPWTGTEQFTIAVIQDAMQRALNQFLLDTGAVLTQSTQVVAAVPSGRVVIGQSIMQIRRAQWKDGYGNYWSLRETDERAQLASNPNWSIDMGMPRGYSVICTSPLEIQLGPPPAESGILDLISVTSSPSLDLTGAGVLLTIPDDFAWIVKWLALHILLSQEGTARDVQRAEYCKGMYDLGVAAANSQGTLYNVEINGVPKSPASLFELDAAHRSWQAIPGTPDRIGVIGDIVAVSPVPDGVYSILADVVSKAPVPAAAGSYIQVGPEHLPALLGYAQHLLSFKQGGTEFEVTKALLKQFIDAASRYNSSLASQSPDAKVIQTVSTRDDSMRPPQHGAIQQERT